ncbi:choice-of-anchor J domain-containing protein [Chryseobacterium terrae]|uniref:Choice-of-anchor J domain-containing protein n=1 Tax=Chryseobacterium terrae TaxID=3163299 RepID=A0ABW8Y2I8_9FLAO
MKKLLLSLSILFTGASAFSQTVLLDENFDSYTDFAITGFGNWQTLDLDGLTTYTGGLPTGGTPWTNAGDPQAFIIFNPTAAGVLNNATPTLDDDETRNFDPHSGLKYAACWAGSPSGGVSANNDWLISPVITLGSNNNVLSLWVKSMSNTYGLEKYRVGIYVGNGTPTSAANFTIISGASAQNAPYPNWAQLTYNLASTYNGQQIRVGIQCVSADSYMFMVDDVKITTTGSVLATDEVSKSKTSIYPNPTKGEVNIKTDKKIKSTTVFDLSGKVISTGNSEKLNLSTFTKGAYLVKVEFSDGSSKTEKIIKD